LASASADDGLSGGWGDGVIELLADALGINLRQGRGKEERDDAPPPVMMTANASSSSSSSSGTPTATVSSATNTIAAAASGEVDLDGGVEDTVRVSQLRVLLLGSEFGGLSGDSYDAEQRREREQRELELKQLQVTDWVIGWVTLWVGKTLNHWLALSPIYHPPSTSTSASTGAG
jgi:hypothetical protein